MGGGRGNFLDQLVLQESLHFDKGQNIQENSKFYEENGSRHDLDLLIISHWLHGYTLHEASAKLKVSNEGPHTLFFVLIMTSNDISWTKSSVPISNMH